jgi:hypothetical protein
MIQIKDKVSFVDVVDGKRTTLNGTVIGRMVSDGELYYVVRSDKGLHTVQDLTKIT